jgi:hypothetical protein
MKTNLASRFLSLLMPCAFASILFAGCPAEDESVSNYCQKRCECGTCSDEERDTCVEDGMELRSDVEDAGCDVYEYDAVLEECAEDICADPETGELECLAKVSAFMEECSN